MTPDSAQILEAYETLNLSIEEICEAFKCESAAVKLVLSQFSQKYNKHITTAKEFDIETSDDFSAIEKLQAKAAIVATLTSEDEYLKLRAAKYIRDDSKGRLDLQKAGGALNINIGQINTLIQQAGDRISKMMSTKSSITIPARELELLQNANE